MALEKRKCERLYNIYIYIYAQVEKVKVPVNGNRNWKDVIKIGFLLFPLPSSP